MLSKGNTRRILLRADGNNSTGLGHLYRLFALMEVFKGDYACSFLTSESSTTEVIPDGYELQLIPKSISIEDEPKWLSENFEPSEHLIIADGYGFNSAYQKAVHDYGFRLAYIDDLSSEHMYADLVINHAIGASEEQYVAQPYSKFALGTDYAILRPEFLAAASKSRSMDQIERVFVCFGGADPQDHTSMVVKSLLKFSEIKGIDVVLGAAYTHEEIFNIAEENNVHIHRNLSASALVEVLENCHLGIVPSSTILYEVCAVKMPVITGYYVDNQKGIYEGFLSRNAVIGLGDMNLSNVDLLEKQISKLVRGGDLKGFMKNQATIFDNKIKNRFLKWMEELS